MAAPSRLPARRPEDTSAHERTGIIRGARLLTVALALALTGTAGAQVNPLVSYARQQAALHGWTGAQWTAITLIVGPESGWNPCRRYPSTTDCRYTGSNSCGIPQRNPCPRAWRGRLWESRFEQVRELMRYLAGRYAWGDVRRAPEHALAFRRAHRWY